MRETELYPAIKRYLEAQGYLVKAEVEDCDLVAVRAAEPPIIVEMKTAFNLPLILQAVDRQALTDTVYVAVPKPSGRSQSTLWRRNRRSLLKLCRRLGLGLITVDHKRKGAQAVEVHLDPAPYQPRKDRRRAGRLLKEFEQRIGDPNVGGSAGRPIVTAYRQDALRCLSFVHRRGTARVRDVKSGTEVVRAGAILLRDYYGWFERKERGVYGVSPQGLQALADFSGVVSCL